MDSGRDEVMETLCGESPALDRARNDLRRLAALDTTVLLGGETGTGKGVAARLLHRLSGRRGALVEADCASLPPSLFESELFGHERGAFTGAISLRRGRFERAAEGTVFLDEIAELDRSLQARLLRVLQDRRFERVGGDAPLAMTARIVAATARDLRAEVAAGRFRADLYYRLAVVRVDLPPLRDRRGDVPVLVRRSLPAILRRVGLDPPILDEGALACLSAHPWWGNVRELLNALERLAIRCPGRAVGSADLEAVLESRPLLAEGARPPAHVAAPAAAEIETALREAGGNVALAARRLGLPRTTLRRRLERLAAFRESPTQPPSRASPSAATSRSAISVRTVR